MKINKLVADITDNCADGPIRLGTLVDSVEENVFGVLLLLPALVVVLPISLIPGLSSFCAVVIFLAACHIFFGRKELWLPQRIRDISFSSRRMSKVLDAAGWCARKIDAVAKPRLSFMTEGFGCKLAAAAVIVLAGTTIIFGFIPLLDIALMCPVIFFGLGTCTGDGLIAALGWVVLAASGCAAAFIL